MATLEELIRRRKAELDLSFRQMGQRAKAAGHPVEPNWSHLTTRSLTEFPKVRTVLALAAALDLPADEVAQAALESIGLKAASVKSMVQDGERWIVVSTEDLSPEDELIIRKKIDETASQLRGRDKST